MTSSLCSNCGGMGKVSEKKINYIWNDEKNLLDTEIEYTEIDCPRCDGYK